VFTTVVSAALEVGLYPAIPDLPLPCAESQAPAIAHAGSSLTLDSLPVGIFVQKPPVEIGNMLNRNQP
jgi:hypothetical protein